MESGIRWLKERTDHAASRRGKEGLWSESDLEVALAQTNNAPRDAERGSTPRRLLFQQRKPVEPGLRRALGKRLAYERERERRLRRLAQKDTERRAGCAAMAREAMSRALVALGVLTIKTRRVSPTLKPNFVS